MSHNCKHCDAIRSNNDTNVVIKVSSASLLKLHKNTLCGSENIIYTHKILSVMGEEKGFLFPGLQEK